MRETAAGSTAGGGGEGTAGSSAAVDRAADPSSSASGHSGAVPGLRPSDAMRLSVEATLRILHARLGDSLEAALRFAGAPVSEAPPVALRSPVADEPNGRWLARENIVGINVRTVGDVWGVVRYVLTVPDVQRGIHLLPMLEPGVVASMYGPASWQFDPAIASADLRAAVPTLDTAERQLRAVVGILHALGRTVGMDVVPHADRFAETVLAQPDHFEWLERSNARIVRFGDAVTADVERWIHRWLVAHGGIAGPLPATADELFRGISEDQRLRLMFGPPEDAAGRGRRRIRLVRDMHPTGYETVPATMAPPYRGLEVDPTAPEIVDANGLRWRDYRIVTPEPQSRVFGPLTRYALHEARAAGSWELDLERPRERVWRYVMDHYADLRERIGFDFMRGDMAHVQMRRDGVPAVIGPRYDILGAVRDEIRARGVRSFAYLAESFLAPPGTMAYGDEADHLEAAGADATLGDLQSMAVDDDAFVSQLRRYRDLLLTRSFAPSFTVMTADKDDPRFDRFYRSGNEVRLFCGLFLPDMPSYMALGYEQRDRHDSPAPNEHYTKLFVFQSASGPNARHGPYAWGRNDALFASLGRIRRLADERWPALRNARVTFLRPPDATGMEKVMAWVVEGEDRLLCVVNLGIYPVPPFGVPAAALTDPPIAWAPAFSTDETADLGGPLALLGQRWVIPGLGGGEARLYQQSLPSGQPPAGAPAVTVTRAGSNSSKSASSPTNDPSIRSMNPNTYQEPRNGTRRPA